MGPTPLTPAGSGHARPGGWRGGAVPVPGAAADRLRVVAATATLTGAREEVAHGVDASSVGWHSTPPDSGGVSGDMCPNSSAGIPPLPVAGRAMYASAGVGPSNAAYPADTGPPFVAVAGPLPAPRSLPPVHGSLGAACSEPACSASPCFASVGSASLVFAPAVSCDACCVPPAGSVPRRQCVLPLYTGASAASTRPPSPAAVPSPRRTCDGLPALNASAVLRAGAVASGIVAPATSRPCCCGRPRPVCPA